MIKMPMHTDMFSFIVAGVMVALIGSFHATTSSSCNTETAARSCVVLRFLGDTFQSATMHEMDFA